jgi:Tfp pilus assembly protein PilN
MLGSTTSTAVMPRVNLLPPEIAEKARLRRAQVAMGCVGLAAIAVVGVMTTSASAKVSSAEAEKTEAAAAGAKLNTELAGLQSVKDTYAQVDAAKNTLATAMQYDVRWSGYLHDMTLTIPENVWLTSFTVAVNAPSAPSPGKAAAASTTSPVLDPGIGTVTISGVAFSHDDVASWLESLAKEKGYANPYFTQSAEALIGDQKVVNFTSTVNITPAALANRYAKGITR